MPAAVSCWRTTARSWPGASRRTAQATAARSWRRRTRPGRCPWRRGPGRWRRAGRRRRGSDRDQRPGAGGRRAGHGQDRGRPALRHRAQPAAGAEHRRRPRAAVEPAAWRAGLRRRAPRSGRPRAGRRTDGRRGRDRGGPGSAVARLPRRQLRGRRRRAGDPAGPGRRGRPPGPAGARGARARRALPVRPPGRRRRAGRHELDADPARHLAAAAVRTGAGAGGAHRQRAGRPGRDPGRGPAPQRAAHGGRPDALRRAGGGVRRRPLRAFLPGGEHPAGHDARPEPGPRAPGLDRGHDRRRAGLRLDRTALRGHEPVGHERTTRAARRPAGHRDRHGRGPGHDRAARLRRVLADKHPLRRLGLRGRLRDGSLGAVVL